MNFAKTNHDRPSFLDRVATAPISWGVCEVPGWGQQLSPDRVLAEMRRLGFTATELGSAGWLPEEVDELRALLDRHDLELLAAFVPLVLHRPEEADAAVQEAEDMARLLQAMGARYFNTAPVTSADWAPRSPLSETEWLHLFAMLDRVEDICREHGLVQVLHEHVGCVVENADDIERVLGGSSVLFVLDTGHLAIGGVDPVDFARHHGDRVGLVHLKDTRLDVARRLNHNELTLMTAVQTGLFPSLGQGDLKVDAVVTTLERDGYDGWYVLEQDCAIVGSEPAPGEGPVRDVEMSVEYLKELAASLQASG